MTIEEEKRLHRVCFTGHRPEKLTRSERLIKRDLEKEIKRAINDGFTTFITGMARGTDIWAAEIVLELKEKGKDIKLICASPYHGFEKCWGGRIGGKDIKPYFLRRIMRFLSAWSIAGLASRCAMSGW